MQSLSKKAAAATISSALRFVFIRLSSQPSLASIRTEVEAEWVALRGASEVYEAARTERVVATAELTYRGALIGEAVIALAREISILVGYNHADERYTQLFPIAPNLIGRLSAKEREAAVLGIIDDLKTKGIFAPVAGHAVLLEQVLSAYEAAAKQRAALYGKELSARATLTRVREKARRFYNRLFLRLSLLFESKALVESFFLRYYLKPAEGEEAEEVAGGEELEEEELAE
jgi:hypothetical protein